MNLIQKISRNPITRNLVLAVCAVAVFAGISAAALALLTRHGQSKPVPDFIGMSISDARDEARRQRLAVEVVDSIYAPLYAGGSVIEQSPLAGTQVKNGRKIFITITSYQQKMVPVPYVTGYSLRQAKNMIEMAGLEIRELRYVSNIATNNVLAQLDGRDTIRRGSNLQLEVGSGITLVVGLAPNAEWVSVPNVVGMTFSEARSHIWERGLNIGEIVRDGEINLINQRDSRVWRQTPEGERQVQPGTKVSIHLTLDDKKLPE